MAKEFIKGLYYITHIENLPSILANGILSHAQVETSKVAYTPIYDSQIVTRRNLRFAPNGQSLWQFANLYFQPRNPMLYRVMQEKGIDNVAILQVKPTILTLPNVYVSTGNAASAPSAILPAAEGMAEIRQMKSILQSEWWKEEDGSKRKIMAECLVPDVIHPEYIDTIYVASHKIAERVRQQLRTISNLIVPEPQMFFQPLSRKSIAHNLSLIEGDMFFSQMQTLTISVNTVGVMGKGLASRTKYQFPDVYVFYEDLCKQKKLSLERPYVYKRESDLDLQLADDSASLPNPNSNKWFLLFATKEHWRQKSTMAGIEAGLKWVVANYEQEGIKSLAMPALGCGLGQLAWEEVGPLMAQYLAQLKIPVSIYLPREQKVPDNQLTRAFLLG